MNRDLLLEYLTYCPKTGTVHWKKSPSPRIKIGTLVGYISKDGYMYFGFKNKTLKLHRAIFLMQFGFLPKFIDHIDGNRLNNKQNNLRDATITETVEFRLIINQVLLGFLTQHHVKNGFHQFGIIQK